MTARLISDFSGVAFQTAFQTYFAELIVRVKDWDGLFREMTGDGNFAYVRMEGDVAVGFIQFKPIALSNWFFEEQAGFIRKFWIDPACREQGHGGALLRKAEAFFQERGIRRVLLTTDSAAAFYEKRGYRKNPCCWAKNGNSVYEKDLGKR